MAKRRWVRLLPDMRREIIRMAAKGATTTEVADELNGRPRQTLGWMTPSERFAEVVAPTA